MANFTIRITEIYATSVDYIVQYNLINNSSNTTIGSGQVLRIPRNELQSYKQSRVIEKLYEILYDKVYEQSIISSTIEPELYSLRNTDITLNSNSDDYSKITLDFSGDVEVDYEGTGELALSASPASLNVNKVTRVTNTQVTTGTDAMWAEIRKGMGELSTVTFSLTGGSGTILLYEQGAGTVEVAVGDQAGTMDVETIQLRWTRA